MFGEKIIQLAQSDTVMEGLVNSEIKVQELNNEFYELTKEYKMSSNSADYYSFFNFSNVYFWFVLAGLLLLAFGLLFLLAELQQRSKSEKTVVRFEEKKSESKPEPKPEPEPKKEDAPSGDAGKKKKKKEEKKPEPEPEVKEVKKSKKPLKVKVVKVK